MQLTRCATALAGTFLACNLTAHAEIGLAAIFGDNMVLQQQQTVPVWGWADPNANVTVKFAGQTKSVRAGADGKWGSN